MDNHHPNTLVAFFSATGETAQAARILADALGADLHAILPATPYTDADLDWHDNRSRSSVEMRDAQARPPLRESGPDMSAYGTLYLGYPIWWDEAPRVINSFLEAHHLEGKRIIPFATSGGSGIGNSVRQLQKAYPASAWGRGRLLQAADEQGIRRWAQQGRD